MSLKAIIESSVVTKLMYTIAASAILGGGTVVLNSQTRLAVLENTTRADDHRLERIEDKIDRLLTRVVPPPQ
jgi:hypothetical protein